MAAKIPLDRVGAIMAAVLTELRHVGGEAKLKDLLDAPKRSSISRIMSASRMRSPAIFAGGHWSTSAPSIA
jgi:hypothetical protein